MDEEEKDEKVFMAVAKELGFYIHVEAHEPCGRSPIGGKTALEFMPMLTFTEHPTAVQLRRFKQRLKASGVSEGFLQMYENCDTLLYERQPYSNKNTRQEDFRDPEL